MLLPFFPSFVLLTVAAALLLGQPRTIEVESDWYQERFVDPCEAAAVEVGAKLLGALQPGGDVSAARDALARAAHRLADVSIQTGATGVCGWARALEHAAPTAEPAILGDLFEALEEERRTILPVG